jgi:F0F1-type ATP synthase delta subunit
MAINPKIKLELENYLKTRSGVKKRQAIITTAYDLESSEIDKLKRTFKFLNDYELIKKVDKSVLGGFIIQYGTKLIDLSLASQLKIFKKVAYDINRSVS